MSKRKPRPEQALREMLTAYFGQKGRKVRGNPRVTEKGVIVKFEDGGPFGLKKLLLSQAALERITDELIGRT